MNRPIFQLFALAICFLGLAGCGDSGDSLTVREVHLAKVFYNGKLIGDVEVRLYDVSDIDGNKPSYVGFSDASGSAYLTPMGENAPPIDSMPWKVSVLSDGDGSWMVDPKFNDPVKSGIELNFGAGDSAGDTSMAMNHLFVGQRNFGSETIGA